MKAQEPRLKGSKPFSHKLYPVLAIDYGLHHIGVAVSDYKGLTTKPLNVLTRKNPANLQPTLSQIGEVIKQWNVQRILLGAPQAFAIPHHQVLEKIEMFKNVLESAFQQPITLYDESFSTVRAKDMLLSQGVHEKKARAKIDSYASALFLQEFLERENLQREK